MPKPHKTIRILIAPNAFKNSLDANSAAVAIQRGLEESQLECISECFPVGDGGDGTGELIIQKCGGLLADGAVHDPLGRKITASFGLIDDGYTAIIEMANASGLRLLKKQELDPLLATSYGTGEQLLQALDKGARKIIIGMGGSATVDCGVGILKALGVHFIDKIGNEINNLPEGLAEIQSIDISELDQRILDTEVIVLCDVNNSLLGEHGSASVFGPQKGASAEAVIKLEHALHRFSEVSNALTGKDISLIKYGGTAGGAAAGLYAILNAKLVNGIDYFLTLTGFDTVLKNTDLVITGEGSIDEQTLQGKGPFGVAQRAKRLGLPVVGFAGKVPLDQNCNLEKYFDVLLPIGHEPGDLEAALFNTGKNLVRVSRELGNLLSIKKRIS